MESPSTKLPPPEEFSIERAEELLSCLIGVRAARVVSRRGRDIQEIHILTTDEVSPKQTVRNVESALLAHFDLTLDHRKISVAQTTEPKAAEPVAGEAAPEPVEIEPVPVSIYQQPRPIEKRLLFLGHQIQTQRSQHARVEVSLEWDRELIRGEASGADVPRSRYAALANATLRAMERALESSRPDLGHRPVSLVLDGIKVVDAFERSFVLVAVHGFEGREVTSLAGASPVEESTERAVVLATLKAADRWVRGRI